MMAKASFTYGTADQSVAGQGKKLNQNSKKKSCDKEKKVRETENIVKAYRLPK